MSEPVTWAREALAYIASDTPVALVTLCAATGSTPRPAGAKMLITSGGQWGSIGGGNLEFQAAEQARALLDQTKRAWLLQNYPLGPLLGQCCGGHVKVLIEKLGAESVAWLKDTATGAPLVVTTELTEGGVVRHVAVASPDRRTAIEMADERHIVETLSPMRDQVFMYGAGHVGQAVARLLVDLPFAVTWADPRTDLLPAGTGGITTRHVDDLAGFAAEATARAMHLVFTHSHQIDYDVTLALLKRDDFRYCGLIGSKTKRARFEKDWRQAGVSDAAIARLECPIGMPGISGKEPEVIAVAVAARLLAIARGPK